MSKDLIVLCDGTGDSPEANIITNVQVLKELLGQGLISTSNYANFSQGWEVNQYESNNTIRIVYYDRGLGSPELDSNGKLIQWSWQPSSFFKDAQDVYDNFKEDDEEITASGIIDNVAQAYLFLVKNYEPGDQIFLFGFSRGSYTLRILIAVIRYIGLIDKQYFTSDADLQNAIEAGFKLYDIDLPPDANSQVTAFRSKCYPHKDLIHFLGLWDTVRGLVVEKVHEDAKLSSAVKTARHAMAIDEQRAIYKPELWIANPNTDSIQMWFAGVHSDIGGGYTESGLSNITLQWMVSEANQFALQVDPTLLLATEFTADPLAMQHDSLHAQITDDLDLTWEHFGSYRRPVMQMTADETLNQSVFTRYGQDVKSLNDNIVYQPPILSHDFTAYNNFKNINSFAEILAKLNVPKADALADVGEPTSLMPKPQ